MRATALAWRESFFDFRGRTVLDTLIIRKTLRVPRAAGPAGDGAGAARQFDAALLSVGFKASGELLEHLSALEPGIVIDTAVHVLAAARGLVGDQVEHNVYFIDFPENVPNTLEFWLECLNTALVDEHAEAADPVLLAGINLLDLPGYGTYQHTYAEMLAAHRDLIPAVTDRVTVLHLGASLDEEVRAVYLDLAGATTPLSDEDLRLLELVAVWCADGPHPETIPVRENRALINRVRLANDQPLLVDTVTDVLRLACALSGGDVSLATATRLRSFQRRDRRTLLAALDQVVAANPGKLADVSARREAFKRLGERLHPHEYPQFQHAAEVFEVARGQKKAPSLAGRVDRAFAAGDVGGAVRLLANAPGLLIRNIDRAARAVDPAAHPEEAAAGVAALRDAVDRLAGQASGRVLLSLREHLVNRTGPSAGRIFVNRNARGWATADDRKALDPSLVEDLAARLDRELAGRLPKCRHLVADPAGYDVALPLSGKTAAAGFRVLPRGSRTPVEADHLRFFIYWKQQQKRTDFDLSALLLDEDFTQIGWLSFTDLSRYGGAHSGDITEAPDGASEFIDLDLTRISAKYVVPQVNVYCGEGFDEVAESFFGYMTRGADQLGKPFEPATVRMRSDLRGGSRVALPMLFARDEDDQWSATWMQLFLRGGAWRNQIEGNMFSSALLTRTIVERQYLRIGYLVDLMRAEAEEFSEYEEGMEFDGPVTFVGLERPEGLPEGSEVFTPDRFNSLVPA